MNIKTILKNIVAGITTCTVGLALLSMPVFASHNMGGGGGGGGSSSSASLSTDTVNIGVGEMVAGQ